MLKKLAVSSLSKNSGKIKNGIMILICAGLFLIMMIPMALFGGGWEQDPYKKAWERIGCRDDNKVILDDVRAIESYVDPDSYENISYEDAGKRLSEIYVDVANQYLTTERICLLKSEDKIFENLKHRYQISEAQLEEIRELLQQVRNGRQYLLSPINGGILKNNYDNLVKGWMIKGKKGAEVQAAADGTVSEISYLDDKIHYEKGYIRGLTVTVRYELQNGINDDAEYDMITIYGRYSMLSDCRFNVDQKIKQGERLAKLESDLLFFEILDEDKKPINPQLYLKIEQADGTLQFPFELPVTITSEMGGRDLDGFHYGLDIVKQVDVPIKALADGEVVTVNSTCAPYGGKLGNRCPEMMPISGGGNHVQIEFEYKQKTYYATYMHMAKTEVHVGDIIHAGDFIGTQGNSGNSTGSHLHLEIHEGTKQVSVKDGLVDPRELLKYSDK